MNWSEYFNESVIIPEKNFEINIDQWREGNPLWITGSSGDGKSTYASKLGLETNSRVVHLDLFLMRICRTKEKYEKWLGKAVNKKGTELVLDYINQHPELPRELEWASKECSDYWNDLFKWILYNARNNPRYRNNKYIIEGCDICYMPSNIACELPLIIMGTSNLQGSFRRIKRDNEKGKHTFIENIFNEIKRSRGYIKDLNKNKDEFKKALIKELDESVNFHIKVYHASKEYYKKLKSVGLDFGNMFQEEGFSLYTWTKYKSAIGWGCFEVLKTLKKIDENVTILGCKNSQNPIITKSVYNYLKDNLHKYNKKLLEFYIYTIQLNSDMELGLGHSSNTPNCITIRQTDDIDYSKVEKYQMTIDMLKKNCMIVDDNYIPTKKDIGVDGRLLTPFMTKDYMYQTATKKQLSNDLKIGKLTPNDNLHNYLINNNMELKKIKMKDRFLNETINSETYYRFEYEGIGIYEAWKNNIPMNKWKAILNSGILGWLPKPTFYGSNNRSYFTERGYKEFMKKTYPLIIKDLDKRKIKVSKHHINESDIVYRDDYQIITKDILNETPLETRLTDIRSNFEKEVTLYHGTDHRIPNKIVDPAYGRINVGTRLSGPRYSTWWTKNPFFPFYYCCSGIITNILYDRNYIEKGTKINLLNMFELTKKYFCVDADNNVLYINKILKNDIMKNLNKNPGYIYKVTVPWKLVGRGHDVTLDEYTLDIPVQAEEIVVDYKTLCRNIDIRFIDESECVLRSTKLHIKKGDLEFRKVPFMHKLVYHKMEDRRVKYSKMYNNNLTRRRQERLKNK